MKILLAEDDPNLGSLIREYLEVKGYHTVLCANGEDALKIFLNELLFGFDISIDDDCLNDSSNPKALREKLSHASFNAYLNFIGSLSIIIK